MTASAAAASESEAENGQGDSDFDLNREYVTVPLTGRLDRDSDSVGTLPEHGPGPVFRVKFTGSVTHGAGHSRACHSYRASLQVSNTPSQSQCQF